MTGWRALKRKASELPALIDYSKKAFCRELCNFLNGLAVARLTALGVSLSTDRQALRVYCILTWKLNLLHFNLGVWTQQMAPLDFAFEVCFAQEYKKVLPILSEN